MYVSTAVAAPSKTNVAALRESMRSPIPNANDDRSIFSPDGYRRRDLPHRTLRAVTQGQRASLFWRFAVKSW